MFCIEVVVANGSLTKALLPPETRVDSMLKKPTQDDTTNDTIIPSCFSLQPVSCQYRPPSQVPTIVRFNISWQYEVGMLCYSKRPRAAASLHKNVENKHWAWEVTHSALDIGQTKEALKDP